MVNVAEPVLGAKELVLVRFPSLAKEFGEIPYYKTAEAGIS